MSIQIINSDGERIFPSKVYTADTNNELIDIDYIIEYIKSKKSIRISGIKYLKNGNEKGYFDEILNEEEILSVIFIKDEPILNLVYTLKEASEKWALADGSSIRKAIERNKFYHDEIKQSGSVWIVTEQGMNRVFGPMDIKDKYIINLKQLLVTKTKINLLQIKDEFDEITNDEREELFIAIKSLQTILNKSIESLAEGKKIIVKTNSKDKPVEILTSKEEFIKFISTLDNKSMLLNRKLDI